MLIKGSMFSLRKRVLPTHHKLVQKMAPCQFVIVLLLGFSFHFCDCSRQIRSAEQQHTTEDHRLLQDTYTAPGAPANHDEMVGETQPFTRLADEMVERKTTSELSLSGKHRQLKSSSRQGNRKLKGREAPDSFIISSRRRRSFLSNDSESAEEGMSSSVVSSESAGGGIMNMDYSPAQRLPPIHNKLSSP